MRPETKVPAESPVNEPKKDGDEKRVKVLELALGAVAVLATIGGIATAYHSTIYVAEMQQNFENATRYQELRLETYAEFTSNVYDVLTEARYPRPLTPEQSADLDKALAKLGPSFNKVRLLGGPEVRKVSHELHTLAVVFAHPDGIPQEKSGDAYIAFINKMNETQQTMRIELGTEAQPGLGVDSAAPTKK